MDSRLEELLDHYRSEKYNLEIQLEEQLVEQDLRMAQRIRKALRLVDQQLRILHNLADQLYDEKQHSITLIERLETSAASSENSLDTTYYQEWIAAEQKKLKLLENQKTEQGSQRTTVLRTMLVKLLARQLPQFELIFHKQPLLSCLVQASGRTIQLAILRVQQLRGEYLLRKGQRKQLKALNFVYHKQEDEFLLVLPFTCGADMSAVQHVFMKLFFEVFYYKDAENQPEIHYSEP